MKKCANCKWWSKLSIEVGECRNCQVVSFDNELEKPCSYKDVFLAIKTKDIYRNPGSLLTRPYHSCQMFDWRLFDRSESNFSGKKFGIYLIAVQVFIGLLIGLLMAGYSYFHNPHRFDFYDSFMLTLLLMVCTPIILFFSLYLFAIAHGLYVMFLHPILKNIFTPFCEAMLTPGGPRRNYSCSDYFASAVVSSFVILFFIGLLFLILFFLKMLHIIH